MLLFLVACLDFVSGVLASDLEAAYTVFFPPSSMGRRWPMIVQRVKVQPGEWTLLPSLAAFQMLGCFCCGGPVGVWSCLFGKMMWTSL
ncbi:hypothetical protein BS78_04G285800 [Paspalum vaginatum]|nr:hypothetical protein BS78_04G285800 [Paspalum vaginatum]